MLRTIFIIFFLISVTAIIYAAKGTVVQSEKSGDILGDKNSFIIEGLEIESDKIDEDLLQYGDSAGQIFFDDNFFDHPEKQEENHADESDEHNIKVIEKNDKTPDFKETFLKELRSDDPRWHYKEYKVRRGDHLSGIALRYKTDVDSIAKINDLENPEMLRADTTIIVPTTEGVFYTIKRGDTLSRLAYDYKVNAEKIAFHNNLQKDRIYFGHEIFIPGGRKPETPVETGQEMIEDNKDTVDASVKGISLIWPVEGRITSAFGIRTDPFDRKKRFHNGIDISVNAGTPVRASADGKVVFSGTRDGYGKMVILEHQGKYLTVYAHNSRNLVKENDIVKQADIIAHSGNTGRVTGAHLHFELRKVDHLTPLDPLRFIK